MEQISLDTIKPNRLRPIKAYRHFRNLIANKEDTEQVFHIINDLSGMSQVKQFTAFINSPQGRKRFEENTHLPPLLDNHAHLETLADGSLGRAYLDFMRAEGLTAQGLVDEYERFDNAIMDVYPEPLKWYFDRRRDTHDMLHVLTGYGRDALGEASVLAFTYAQYSGLGVAFIAYGAGNEIRKGVPKSAKVMKAVHQGYKNGKLAKDIIDYDIMELLKRPLKEVRQTLNIKPASAYHRAHTVMRAHGINPYEMVEPISPAETSSLTA